jgi:hypothetical protein
MRTQEEREVIFRAAGKRASVFVACHLADLVLHIFEKAYPSDFRPREALNAARAWLADPNAAAAAAAAPTAYAAAAAAYTTTAAAYAASAASAAASTAYAAAAAAYTTAAAATRAAAYADSSIDVDKEIDIALVAFERYKQKKLIPVTRKLL